jgi:hypothetical protein
VHSCRDYPPELITSDAPRCSEMYATRRGCNIEVVTFVNWSVRRLNYDFTVDAIVVAFWFRLDTFLRDSRRLDFDFQ